MTRQLIFIHGRSQQNKDAVALKAEWVNALNAGLRRASIDARVADQSVRFPYYGQTLYDLVAGLPAGEAAAVIIKGTGSTDGEQAFAQELVGEIAKKAAITEAKLEIAGGAAVVPPGVIERGALNWPLTQAVLGAIDQFVPYASGASIALFTRDVYQYLSNPGIRDSIESGIRAAFTPGLEIIVVSHSLGTVVAYNLLRREGHDRGWIVPLFVTLGSPLAVRAIKKRLVPHSHPACVGKWFNAMDDGDVVALYPLDATNFAIAPPVENKTDVENFTENQHGIAGYLDDPVVARRIYEAANS